MIFLKQQTKQQEKNKKKLFISPQRNFVRKIPHFVILDPIKTIRDFYGDIIPDWLVMQGLPSGNDMMLEYFHNPEDGFVWFPIGLTEGIPSYSAYYTVVNTLDFLYRLQEVSENVPNNVMQALVQIMDRYQLLSLHMEEKKHYMNEQLATVYHESEVSPLDIFYPTDDVIFNLYELPDLYTHVMYCDIWGKTKDKPYTDPTVLTIITILNKALPFPCKGRSPTTILPPHWYDMKVVNNIVMRIIMGGILGVYPHSKIVANFHVRRLMYRFFSLTIPTKEVFEKWLNNNKDLVIYIFRDYVLYMIEGVPPLQTMLCSTYYWKTVVDSTREGMDKVRKWLNQNITYKTTCLPDVDFSGEDVTLIMKEECEKMGGMEMETENTFDDFFTFTQSAFDATQSIIEPFKKKNLKDCPRPITQSFLDKIYKKMMAIEDLYYNSGDKELDETYEAPDGCYEIIWEIIIRMVPDDIPDYSFLIFFGVKLGTIELLKKAEDEYNKETNRSKLDKVILNIHDNFLYDYNVLKTFFFALKKRVSIQVYDLPIEVTLAQIKRFKEEYQLMPGEKLPEFAGQYYVCTSCGIVKTIPKTKMAPRKGGDRKKKKKKKKKNPLERKHGLCHSGITIDTFDNKKFCSKKPSKNNPKKRLANVDIVSKLTSNNEEKNDIKERKKTSKKNRKKIVSDACPVTELIPYNSIGRIISTSQGHLFNCINCLCLTPLSRDSFVGGHSSYPSCGCMSLKQEVDNTESWGCAICNRVIHKPKNVDQVETEVIPEEKKKKIPNSQIYTEHLVYNDESKDGNKQLQIMKFCFHHPCTWILKFERILKLSEIRNALLNDLHSSVIAGERLFMQNRYNRWSKQGLYPNFKKYIFYYYLSFHRMRACEDTSFSEFI